MALKKHLAPHPKGHNAKGKEAVRAGSDYLPIQARGNVLELAGEVFLFLFGKFHVFECLGGGRDEFLDVAVRFGSGEFGHEVFVGCELRDGRGDVGIARKFTDLFCNILVTKKIV